MFSRIAGERRAQRDALLAALTVAAVTSVHHAYGAAVYHTPWRYHAVALAMAAVTVLLAAQRVSRAAVGATARRVAWWTFWGVNAAVFVALLGAFEGLYNHALKDLLYFGSSRLIASKTM